MVLGSCVSLQVGAALAAHLFPVAGSAGATLLRLGLAAAVLLIMVRPRVRGWDRRQWRLVLAFGVCMAGMNGSFYASIEHMPLGLAVTVEFLGPLTLAALTSRRVRDLSWVLLALAGVVLLGVTSQDTAGISLTGLVFALVAGTFWALYILIAARVGSAVPGQGGLAVAVAIGALALAPLGAAGAARAVAEPELLLLALGTGVLAAIIPYSLEMSALRRLPPRVFGVLLSLEPAIAALAGWLLLSQRLGGYAVAAVIAVIAASVGSTLSTRRPALDLAGEPRPPARSGGRGRLVPMTRRLVRRGGRPDPAAAQHCVERPRAGAERCDDQEGPGVESRGYAAVLDR